MEKRKANNLVQRLMDFTWLHHAWVKRGLLLLLDAGWVVLAYLFTLLFRYGGAVPERMYACYLSSIGVIVAIHWAVNGVLHLYSSMWEYAGLEELVKIIFACPIAALLCYVYAIIRADRLPRSVYIAAGLILMLLFGGTRMSYRVLRRFVRGGFLMTRETIPVLLVGAGATGVALLKQIQERERLSLRPVGFVDDDPDKKNIRIQGVRVLGKTEDIPALVQKYYIKQIIFAVPSADGAARRRMMELCTKTGCKLKIVPGLDNVLEGVDIKRMRDVDIGDLLAREEVQLEIENISQYLQDSVVLVTGGGGSIGSELCMQIAPFRPARIVIFDIYENDAYALYMKLKQRYQDQLDLRVEIGSVQDADQVSQLFATYRPDVVFHAAAHKHVPLMERCPAEAVKNNVEGTFIVSKAADVAATKRFILISTDKAVNPANIMGATKYLCELIMQYFNQTSKATQYVTVRFGNVLGSNGSVVPLFRQQIEAGGPVTVTHKDVTRYFMTIPEAARLVIQAGSMAAQGEVFVLDMGQPVSIDQFARTFIRLSGFEPDVDIPIVYTGLRPGEKMYEELLNPDECSKSTFPGILVGKPHPVDAAQIYRRLSYLFEQVEKEPTLVHRYMAQVVPTYHPADCCAADDALVPTPMPVEYPLSM